MLILSLYFTNEVLKAQRSEKWAQTAKWWSPDLSASSWTSELVACMGFLFLRGGQFPFRDSFVHLRRFKENAGLS